ncbi:MAG: hypothetical protein ACE5FD_07510 [Anaerolineae bacterium]
MPVSRKQMEDNVIYTLTGPFDVETANHYQDLNAEDYNRIGDALGAIIDFRPMEKVTVSGLRTIQQRLQGVRFDTPVAFVGNTESIFITFLRGLEALTSRGKSRFGFFTNIEEAVSWIDAWYITHRKDREELRGQVTTEIKPQNQS